MPAKKPDPTHALRQRKYRQKQKAASRAVTVAGQSLPSFPAPKSNVVKGRVTPRPHRHRALTPYERQAYTAAGIGLVVVTLTILSLSHLAHGIGVVTHAAGWQSWAMAVGIDLSFIALEVAQLAIAERTRRQVLRFAAPAIGGTLAGSAMMNAAGFAHGAGSVVMTAAAILLGIAIPALIYGPARLTRPDLAQRCASAAAPRLHRA